MIDAVTVLQGIQERDKWQRRAEVLERSLGEVRERLRRTRLKLRRVERDLVRIRQLADSMPDLAIRPSPTYEVRSAPRGPLL